MTVHFGVRVAPGAWRRACRAGIVSPRVRVSTLPAQVICKRCQRTRAYKDAKQGLWQV